MYRVENIVHVAAAPGPLDCPIRGARPSRIDRPRKCLNLT